MCLKNFLFKKKNKKKWEFAPSGRLYCSLLNILKKIWQILRKLTQNIRNKISKKTSEKKWKNKRKFNLISSYPPFQEIQATLHFKNFKLPSISRISSSPPFHKFQATFHFKNFKLPSISRISSYPPFQEFQTTLHFKNFKLPSISRI